jgi:hypothetical protein
MQSAVQAMPGPFAAPSSHCSPGSMLASPQTGSAGPVVLLPVVTAPVVTAPVVLELDPGTAVVASTPVEELVVAGIRQTLLPA